MDIKVRLAKLGAFPINEELAGLVPMATTTEQIVLTNDIEENGQKDPITLWKGEVIDGRCRMKALVLLGRHILYKELADEVTEEDAAIYVKSVNTRRNLTHTQKIVSACRQSLKKEGKSIATIAKQWGISRDILSNARFIADKKPEFIQPLFEGNSVKITNAEGKEVDSNKISTIYAALKRETENVSEDDEYGWKADSYIKAQKGKEWYYEQLKSMTDTKTKMLIAELANYKFKLGDSK